MGDLSGIGLGNLKNVMQNQNINSLAFLTVGSGSTVSSIVIKGTTMVAGVYAGQSVVFSANTLTPALQGVGAKISTNTTIAIDLTSNLPAVPQDGDTLDVQSLGLSANIIGLDNAPLPSANGTPQIPVQTTTAPTLIAKAVSGTSASASTSLIENYATLPRVTSSIGTGNNPTGVAVDATNGWVYVTNANDNTVYQIVESSGLVENVITVGHNPTGVAANATTNTAYVTNYNDGTVSVIDGATGSVTTTITVGANPYDVAVDASSNTIYVANFGANTVSVIDGANNTVTHTISVGGFPSFLAVDTAQATHYVYVANNNDGTVSVIDCSTNAVTTTVTVGNNPHGVAVDNTNNYVYVCNQGDDTVSVIDGATNTVTSTITVGKGPYGAACDASAGIVYVTNQYGNSMTVISTSQKVVQYTLDLSGTPQGIDIDGTLKKAYVALENADTLSVISFAGSAYTVPYSGTVKVAIALSASTTLSLSRNASISSPSYNTAYSGAALTANAEYAFDILVSPNEVLDFQLGAAADLNVFEVWYVPTQ